MIVRVWKGWARPGLADRYEAHYRSEVAAHLQGVDGFLGARLLRREADGEVELVSMTYFRDLDAVRAFAGPTYEQAVVEDAARAVLTRFEETVAHFDVAVTIEGAGGGPGSDGG
ncbi:MAG TPA: antibiotic biosynthesis monooxygenase [Acidimicrobiales bacterium]